ncbi:protein GPR107 [Teleopsis dalmanni]|uniref:protein GPR107 n=1 Tax=Teleopsis dalmanni TaxID=139649 RepID=UPI0018CE77E4|nr:protein GPR107 [Teleopsis dalmanni]
MKMKPPVLTSTALGDKFKSIFVCLILTVFITHLAEARKHHLEVRNDIRPYIALSTFGFYTGGYLDVKLSKLNIDNENPNEKFGLSLDKTTIDQMNPYLDSHQNKCILEEQSNMQTNGPILFFLLDLKNLHVKVQCSPEWQNMHIYKDRSTYMMFRGKRQSLAKVSDSSLFSKKRNTRDIDNLEESEEYEPDNVMPIEAKMENLKTSSPVAPVLSPSSIKPANTVMNKSSAILPSKHENDFSNAVLPVEDSAQASSMQSSKENMQAQLCKDFILPLTKTVINGQNYYNMSFSMLVTSILEEGLYNLYFHSCPNYSQQKIISFNVDIEENNNGNFLSAGEMPLPALYFMMSLLFFLSGLFWVFILKKSKHSVYKIHYIMAVLVFLKSLSLLFHSINYHFINTRGEHIEAWAILYYIAHLLKGAVLFITIVLIGTGWTFIKHILSDKDKKIFMIVIPLQVLANVAEIIIDESEESDIEFRMWRNIFIFVDLLCCGAILFPIVWSIRHLHEASATDGKAAINLRKLKLFRQFYIMIVCYIYFTRIIVYLLKMTVAFQYAWLDEMFHEMATYVFFVLTGYKFRPASSHPYFAVGDEDPDDDVVEVLTESGLTQGLHRTKAQNRSEKPSTIVIEGNDEERENLITKRESSHEYD